MIPRQPSATPLGVAGPRSHLRPQMPSPIAEPAGNGSFAHCKIEEQASTTHRKTNNLSKLKSTDKTHYGVAVQWLNLDEHGRCVVALGPVCRQAPADDGEDVRAQVGDMDPGRNSDTNPTLRSVARSRFITVFIL